MFDIGKKKIHVVKYRVLWVCLSALLLLPCIGAMVYSMITYPTHTPVKVGIDYTGGTIMQYGTSDKVTTKQIEVTREKLEKIGVESPYVQVLSNNATTREDNGINSVISIRTPFLKEGSKLSDEVTGVVSAQYHNTTLLQFTSIGATLGKELLNKSLIALGLAVLGIVAYVSFRFKLDYGIAAILGLLHDCIFVVGAFSLMGIFWNVQIDGLFITAILTIIGFSINDTIVTFDRIRENLRYYGKKMSFGEIVDASVNQTLARSINTSLTAFLTLLALYLFGGSTTKDFVLAMMLGIVVGVYSSIFFCCMLVDFWEERKSVKKEKAVEVVENKNATA